MNRQSGQLYIVLASLLVSSCASKQPPEFARISESLDSSIAVIDEQVAVEVKPAIDLRMRTGEMRSSVLALPEIEVRNYSLQAKKLPIRSALSMFARMYDLNIISDPEIKGTVNVSFKNLSLNKAMDAILSSFDYAWVSDDGLIRVSELATQSYTLDYIRLVRGGSGSSQSSISNQNSGESSGSTETEITKKDVVEFWSEIENQISMFVSKRGRIAINRLSGTVLVTDAPSRLKEIERFIHSLSQAMHRQVEIETRIIEVSLRSDNSLGIDWSQIDIGNITGSTSNLALSSSGGLQLKSASVALNYNGRRFNSLLEALSEQGDVKVVSQPKIRSINNQTAMIKVGTDLTFFTKTATRSVNNGVVETIESETATTVTEGVVLAVTPQISRDGWVMLDIAPTITRVADTIVSDSGSTAPVLEVKQATALVRARDGEMIILGGLIQEHKGQNSRKVPLLGDIPLIGAAFSSSYDTISRKELVILIQPRIVGREL